MKLLKFNAFSDKKDLYILLIVAYIKLCGIVVNQLFNTKIGELFKVTDPVVTPCDKKWESKFFGRDSFCF